MRLVWTEPALRDLLSARAWIAAERPMAAARQIARIVDAVAILPDFPDIGRSGRRHGTQELVVVGTPFLVAYRRKDESLEILRVLHAARRWPARL